MLGGSRKWGGRQGQVSPPHALLLGLDAKLLFLGLPFSFLWEGPEPAVTAEGISAPGSVVPEPPSPPPPHLQ